MDDNAVTYSAKAVAKRAIDDSMDSVLVEALVGQIYALCQEVERLESVLLEERIRAKRMSEEYRDLERYCEEVACKK